jgi:hypothetical protein
MSFAKWRQTVLAALSWLLLTGAAAAQMATPALRSAVPLLCTENGLAPRTRVRGTGVVADSGGTLLTAAHVTQEAHEGCTLSVMIPDDEWNRFRQLHAFLIKDCRLFLPTAAFIGDIADRRGSARGPRRRGNRCGLPPSQDGAFRHWSGAGTSRVARYINGKTGATVISLPTSPPLRG